MTPKIRSIKKGIKPKPAGLCLCEFTFNCVQKRSDKSVGMLHCCGSTGMSLLRSLTVINVPVKIDVFPLSMQVTWCHRPVLQDILSLRQHTWRWMLMMHGGTSLWISS